MVRWRVIVVVLGLLLAGCVPSWIALAPIDSNPKVAKKAIVTASASSHPSLSNLIQVTDGFFSGGEPTCSDDFATLVKLGVRTVVSVDGIRPDLKAAAEHGLDYVHIPIGYDGVGNQASLSLVRLVRDRRGPFYIHCHHGRHRGPAATAIACRASGSFGKDEALKYLARAGTDPLYEGLYRDVADFEMPDETVELPALVSAANVANFAEQMARIDRAFETLNSSHAIKRADSLLLLEAFQESIRCLSRGERSISIESHPDGQGDLINEMHKATEDCERLHNAKHKAERAVLLRQLEQRCASCHRRFRDS